MRNTYDGPVRTIVEDCPAAGESLGTSGSLTCIYPDCPSRMPQRERNASVGGFSHRMAGTVRVMDCPACRREFFVYRGPRWNVVPH